jgi:hypothetical protein
MSSLKWKVISRVVPHHDPGNSIWSANEDGTGVIGVSLSKSERYRFELDEIFGPKTNQIDLYGSILPSVQHVLNGKNSTVFAFGAKGSGRKYTILGKTSGPELQSGLGLAPRVAQELFRKINASKRSPLVKYKLALSILSVTNKVYVDMIHPNNKNLRAVETGEGDVAVPDLSLKYLNSPEEVIPIIKRAFYPRKKKGKQKAVPGHLVVTYTLERWNRVNPNSPAATSVRDDDKSPQRNALGGDTPARSIGSGNAPWRCNKSYIRFVNLLDMTINQSDENVSQTMSGFLRCVGANGTTNQLPCRDSKLTYVLKSSFLAHHMNVFIAHVSQRTNHATESVIPTLKLASRVLHSGGETKRDSTSTKIEPEFGTNSDGAGKWAWVEYSTGEPMDISAVSSFQETGQVQDGTNMDDQAVKEVSTYERTSPSRAERKGGAGEETGSPRNTDQSQSIRMMRPLLKMDGLRGSISLDTPDQLRNLITANAMDELEESLGPIENAPVTEQRSSPQPASTEKELCPDGFVAQQNVVVERDTKPVENEVFTSSLQPEDDEVAALEARLNAQIMGLKLGVGIADAGKQQNGSPGGASPTMTGVEKGSAAADSPTGSSPGSSVKKRISWNSPAKAYSQSYAHVMIPTNAEEPYAHNAQIENTSNTITHLLNQLTERDAAMAKFSSESNSRIEFIMAKYRELDETAGKLWQENSTLRVQLEHFQQTNPPNGVLQAKLEQMVIAHQQVVSENMGLKIELAKITGVAPEDVSMSDDNGDKEKLEEDRKTQLEKIEGLEKSLQLQSEANKRLNEKCEVSKKKNKVLTQDNETQLKEIAGLQTKLHQAVESKESSERKLKIEQSALAEERKSAKDTKASLQAMEETHKAQRKMELAETAARETEMEQLRIALSKASNELRLVSDRSSSLENKIKSEELGSAQMRQMISDSMNQLQAAHSAETSRLVSMNTSLGQQLQISRSRIQELTNALAKTEQNNRNLIGNLEITEGKLQSAEASLLETKQNWAEEMTEVKVTNSREVTSLHTERESLIRRLAQANEERDEMTDRIISIESALRQEKNARERSDLASKTYHQQIQTSDKQLDQVVHEKEAQISELEKTITSKEADLQASIESRRELFERMELLKSKMSMAMATNEKLLHNAKTSADEYMQKNIQLLQEKQALALREEHSRMRQHELEKNVDRLNARVSSLQGADKIVSSKLNGAMQQITSLMNAKAVVEASMASSTLSDSGNADLELTRAQVIIKNKERELGICKRESDTLAREANEARSESQSLLAEVGGLRLKVETLRHEKAKLKKSFERSQAALGKALTECQNLLNAR